MRSLKGKTNSVVFCLRSLGPLASVQLLVSRLFSINHFYLLGRNLTDLPTCPPVKKSGGRMIPASEDDFASIRESIDSMGAEDRKEILSRNLFYESGFRNCFVMKNGNEIGYMQWLILPEENHVIAQKYPGRFRTLSDRQVMIENAFTFPRYRGQGYLQQGTLQLLELAGDNGFTSAICYVRKDRIAALNEFCRLGFRIVKLATEYKLLGKVWRKF